MLINNEILYDFLFCRYKAYRKSKHQTGIISKYKGINFFEFLKSGELSIFKFQEKG